MFRKTTFKDFVTLQRGFDLPAHQREEGEYPVVASTSITGTHSEWKVEPPGVVTGRSGALGEVQYITKRFWPLNTALWVKDFKGNDPYFVYYKLKTLDLKRFNSGAGVPTLNRNDLDTLELEVPDLPTQRRIASILSAYDDLIENNTRRIAILEEMARRIYEEWFVRFRFPGHEQVKMVESELGLIPEGWSVKGVYDIADVTYGFPFKSKEFRTDGEGRGVIRIRDIRDNQPSVSTEEQADDKYIVSTGDILIGMDGQFHMNKWAGPISWLNQRVVRLKPRVEVSANFLFHAVRDPIRVLEQTIVGTTVAHLSAADMKAIRLVIPTVDVMEKAKELLDGLLALELNLQHKNAHLRATRDLLLPKLISGELDVSNFPEQDAIAA